MNEDITFCNKQKCKIMSCERNPNNIKKWYMYHSYAKLENTEYCPKQVKKDGKQDVITNERKR